MADSYSSPTVTCCTHQRRGYWKLGNLDGQVERDQYCITGRPSRFVSKSNDVRSHRRKTRRQMMLSIVLPADSSHNRQASKNDDKCQTSNHLTSKLLWYTALSCRVSRDLRYYRIEMNWYCKYDTSYKEVRYSAADTFFLTFNHSPAISVEQGI